MMTFSKSTIFLFLACVLNQITLAQKLPKVSPLIEEKYKETYLRATKSLEYFLVDEVGTMANVVGYKAKSVAFIMRLAKDEPARYFYSDELNMILKNHYEMVMIDGILQSKDREYFIVSMIRPAEYKDNLTSCIQARSDEKNYLMAVSDNKLQVIDRNFPRCGASHEVVSKGKKIGYIVTDSDIGKITEFLLVNGKIKKQPSRLIRDVDR